MDQAPETSDVGWTPILTGERRARALEAVDAVLRDVEAAPEPETAWDLVARALLFSYASVSVDTWRHMAQRARDAIDRACDVMNDVQDSESLFGGWVGVAWGVEHVLHVLDGDSAEDRCESVDAAVQALLADGGYQGPFDLIHGLTGLGVYALERGAVAEPLAASIVDALRSRARKRDHGRALHTDTEWLHPHTRADSPDGHDDLGLAHGTPGVVSLLSRMATETSVAVDDLLTECVRWTLAQCPAGKPIPKWVASARTPLAPYAWCYGAPGVAASVLLAARAAGDAEWRSAGIDLACRPPNEAQRRGVADAGLCHGTSGLAHVFHRLSRLVGGDERLHRRSLEWYERTLERRGDRGLGGFEALVPERPDSYERVWRADATFLTGSIGIALSLLAGATSVEPAWDRLLLLSLRATR